MGRLTALKLVRRALAESRLNVVAKRVRGVCMLFAIRPPRFPWERSQRIILGQHRTWLGALKMAKSGYARMVA